MTGLRETDLVFLPLRNAVMSQSGEVGHLIKGTKDDRDRSARKQKNGSNKLIELMQ